MRLSGGLPLACVVLSGWLMAVLSAGCAAPKDTFTGLRASQEARGLQVALEVPRAAWRVGDKLPVTIIATNNTKLPIGIQADGPNLAEVRIYQDRGGLGWDEVKRYPDLAREYNVRWSLAPKASRSWTLPLTVEPDWPTSEKILIRGFINHWPGAQPGVLIEVCPRNPKPQ